MKTSFRTVPDTNVIIAAQNGSPTSPNQEYFTRWKNEEFALLFSDDIAFVLCAENGYATHLISYDKHLLDLQGFYSYKICKTLDFLSELRQVLAGFSA